MISQDLDGMHEIDVTPNVRAVKIKKPFENSKMYIGKENNKSYYNSPSKQTIGFTPSKSAQSIAAAWGTAASQTAPSFKEPSHSPKRVRTPSKPMNTKVQTPKKAKSPITVRPANSPQQNPSSAIPFQFTLTPSKNSHFSNTINVPSAVGSSPSQNAKMMRGQSSKLSPLPSAAALSPLAWSPTNRRSPFKGSVSPLWSPNANLKSSSPSVVAHSVAPLNFTEELVCDEYGFFVDMNCDENSPTFKRTMHPIVTPSRSFDKQSWERYLADENPILDAKMVDNLILKGIHPECRANVWRKLLNVDAMKEYYRSEGIYYNYLRGSGSNAHTAQIKLDLNITFPPQKLFQQKKGLDTLYNILAAYSHFNQSVGYCQGMAYVCGVLMMHFEEEDAFWTFVCMMKKVEKYYGSKMEGVLSDTNLLTSFMKFKMPELFSHLQEHRIDTLLFSSKWLLSMFTDLPNWESVLRIWDIFFLEGRKGLLRVCLGILSNCEEELCAKTGIEQIMPFVCNPPAHVVSPSTLFSKIHKIDIDELYVQIQTPQCTPQSNGVFSFFNNMVSSIDTLLTPKTVDRTARTRRQIYETPSKSNLITMTPSVARNIVASTPVVQNVNAFADFATPKYLREKVIDEQEELTPRKRQAVQDANDGVYPVKRLRF